MRISLLTMGSRGDVQPIVALGQGLAEAGHRVRIVTHANFEGLVRGRGLEYAAAEGDPQTIVGSPEGRQRLGEGGVAAIRWLAGELVPLAQAYARDCLAACGDADVVGTSLVNLLIGQSVAERVGAPWFAAYPVPIAGTRAFPSPILPAGLHRVPGWNRLSHRVFEAAVWTLTRSIFGRVRSETLGLPPYPRMGPFRAIRQSGAPLVVGVSRHVLPDPADWPAPWDLSGYWFLPPVAGWVPPDGLEAFLDAGPPPVYAGFGSMAGPDPGRDARMLLEAAEEAGVRLVLSRGWAGLHAEDLPPWAFAVGDVSHDWLFPRMAAVVHHAGAGTTAAAFRAGVPHLPVPFFGDQPFWAWRSRALGVSPPPVPYARLSVPRLAAALRACVRDDGLRARAAALGAAVRSEDGIGRAVGHLHRLWNRKLGTATNLSEMTQ